MKGDYLEYLLKVESLSRELRKLVKERYYREDGSLKAGRFRGNFCYYPIYRGDFEPIKRTVEICDFLGIRRLEQWKPVLETWVRKLEDPIRLRNKTTFDKALGIIEKGFREVKIELKEALSLLDSTEKDRLNEAIHCFLEGCYYSAVAMSVSAIEFRLFSLMMSKCPDPKLEELTLGQLIREYLDNKQKYSDVIPKKHEPLLEHCNTYRIFSVHPKGEKINKPIASSILNMTFLFLLDKNLIEKAKEGKS